MILEVARYEFRVQTREFLTWVYFAVFFFLTFGYAASGAVELVGDRGDVPRYAPWAMAHAMAGVTAFGQVITTMITATAVMRDVATRQQELLFTTPLTRGDYLVGRWLGALGVMAIVYLAIPAGLLTGFAVSDELQPALITVWWPLRWLVVPNVLVVSALFFTAGAMRRGFMAILLIGVGLVALWGTGLSLVRDGVIMGAWLDPFGNAAVEWSTGAWSPAQRTTDAMDATRVLWQNRALWAVVALTACLWCALGYRMTLRDAAPASSAPERHRSRVQATWPVRAVPLPGGTAVWLQARWTLRWTLREKGFLTLASLGALNALVNAWRVGGDVPGAGAIMGAVHEHSRVFLILLATIYAGELVWRDRELRVHELRDTLPVSSRVLAGGQVMGLLAAQMVIVLPLLLVGLVVSLLRVGSVDVATSLGWAFGVTWTFVAQITLVSLLIHVVVQNKVGGHVALIAGWVAAVAIERAMTVPLWLRYAALPDGWSVRQAVWLELWWSALAAACCMGALLLWIRGNRREAL